MTCADTLQREEEMGEAMPAEVLARTMALKVATSAPLLLPDAL
jgi:hypothetical protein